MAQQDEGIMALNAANAGAGMPPEDTEIDMREFRRQVYPVAKDAVREVDPAGYGEMQSLLSSELAGVGDLDPEGIKQLLEIVDYINDNPEEYAKVRAALIAEGVIDEDDFPPEMDVEYFATLEVVLQEALMGADAQAAEMAQGPVGMMPPQGFAKGGIAEAAQLVAGRGRYGDTMLAHITPAEARLLRSRGGSGTINPETGLPEFFKKFFKKVGKAVEKNVKSIVKIGTAPIKAVVKAVKPVVKKVLASPIGRMAVTIGLTMVGVPPPIASALVTKAAGGSWKDAFKAAAVSYLAGPTSPLANTVTSATPFLNSLSPAMAAGIRSGLTSTGASLLTGSSLKEAVTAGVTSGLATGIQASRASAAFDRASEATAADALEAGRATPESSLLPGQAAPEANLIARPLTPADAFGTATAPAAAGTAPVSGGYGLGPDAYSLAPPTPSAAPYGLQPSAFDLSSGMADSGFGVRAPTMAPAGAPAAPASQFAEFLPSTTQPGAGAPPPVDDRSMYQKAKDFMFPSKPTDAQIKAEADKIYDTYGGKMSYGDAIKRATDSLTPGIIAQYGPSVAAGLGVMALTGGFKPKEPEPSPIAERISAPIEVPESLQKPIQNLPGVVYDSQGNIIGSKPWDPYTSSTMAQRPTEVSTPGIMSLPLPPNYLPPPSSPTMGMGPVQQPFNTSSMYTNLMQPQRYNAGGIAGFARGGYPRRIGQIDGPGTETSDDIPAMLSDGEFVMTARAVRGAGNGSRREGAKKMYAMMHQLEKNAARG